MKNLILSLSVFFLLSACGGDDKSTTTSSGSGIADTGPQNVSDIVIPQTAIVEDYSCDEVSEYSERGQAERHTEHTTGVTHSWRADIYSFTLDQLNDGSFTSFTKIQKITIDASQYRNLGENTLWMTENGATTRQFYTSDRLWQKDGAIRRVLDSKVNGANKPYYWTSETTEVDAKNTRVITRHTNPSVRDHDGRSYNRIEETCLYTERSN